jgi:hypothetical protein
MYFLWLGYFYLAMALRENVLLVNGSAIKVRAGGVHNYLSPSVCGACGAPCVF